MTPTMCRYIRFVVPLFVLAAAAALVLSAGCGTFPVWAGEQATAQIRGDVDGDGIVTEADLEAVTGAFGRTRDDPLFLSQADLDGDGVIGLEDVQAVIQILDDQAQAAGG